MAPSLRRSRITRFLGGAVVMAVAGSCTTITDSCACTRVPPLTIFSERTSIRVGDSVALHTLGPAGRWESEDTTIVVLNDSIGPSVFAKGVRPGMTGVWATLGADSARAVLTVTTP